MNSKYFKNITETERLSRSEAVDCVKDGVLIIPDSKKILDLDFAFFVVREDLPHIHTLIIPASVINIVSMRGDRSLGLYGYKGNPFSEIVVAEDNQKYSSKDGVLFNKNMDTLLYYPCGRPDQSYHVPATVERIKSEAFLNVEHLKQIFFPDNIQIEEYAFVACIQTDFPGIVDIYKNQSDYVIVVRNKSHFQISTGDKIRCFAYNSDDDISDRPVHGVDEDDLESFLHTGAHPVKEYDDRIQIIRRLVDLIKGFGYDNSDSGFESDLIRFVDTFYGNC